MLIPVRCYTCGKVVGNKYNDYLRLVESHRVALNPSSEKDGTPKSVVEQSEFAIQSGDITLAHRTPEGKALDDLKLKRYCCRRMLLTHVDIIKYV